MSPRLDSHLGMPHVHVTVIGSGLLAMDYINTVPDEILVRFFDGHATLEELWNCAFVSKRWFAVTKDHSAFWGSAEFGMLYKVSFFLECLNRRPGLPIKIRACGMLREDHVPGYEAIGQNMHRITELDIYTWNEEWVLHSPALAVPAPRLETLRLEAALDHHLVNEIITPPSTLFQGSTPYLTSVVLLNASFIFAAPDSLRLPSVQSVSITHLKAYDIPWDGEPVDALPDDDAPWLLPASFDLLDRVAATFPRMRSLQLRMRAAFTPARGGGWQMFRHYPAATPSDRTLRVLRALKHLDASWCAAGWSVLQHFDLQSLLTLRLWTDHADSGVAALCAPPRPYTALVGLDDNHGVIDLSSVDGACTRTISAGTADCWSPLFLGALFAAQPDAHLTALSLVFPAWEMLLASGMHALPALRTLRIEFPRRLFTRGIWQAAPEDLSWLDCSGLRVVMLEADAPHAVSEDLLEAFLGDLDAPFESAVLALRHIAVVPSFRRRGQFARVVVDGAPVDAHEGWLARADVYLAQTSNERVGN